MIGLRIGAAELAEIEAGAPAVVLADGVRIADMPPLVPLVLEGGVLVRFGDPVGRSLKLPPGTRFLALVAPADDERLRSLLPGVPLLSDPALLPAVLAEALREATAARQAAEAEAGQLRRALGTLTVPRPSLALDLAPISGTGTAPPLAQPLGRPAHGICGVAVHIASAGAGPLRVRLVAKDRIVARWHVPEDALAPGWLALDLPEPATGDDDAMLELVGGEGGTPPLLTLSGEAPRAGIAIRVWTAPPGWSVLPRFFDWAARDTRLPAAPMRVPADLLAAAAVEGARAELVATGDSPPHLLLEIPAHGAATVAFPPLPTGPADLLTADLAVRGDGAVSVALSIAGEDMSSESGWRAAPAGDAIALALPLPAGAMVTPRLALRQDGDAPAIVELGGLALVAGAAGQPRRPPPFEAAIAAPRRPVIPVPLGKTIPPWRDAAPPPNVGVARAPAAVAALPIQTGVALRPPPMPAGISAFQELRLYQHLDSATATYRHLDVGLSGLVSAGGLWRQVRTKLFDRRGVVGLEFRQAKGWPLMFDTWPKGGTDTHGPFWRIESEATAEALAALSTPHDRALVAAIMEVLPEIADRAARAAKVDRAAAELWAGRARLLADAVAAARGLRGAA